MPIVTFKEMISRIGSSDAIVFWEPVLLIFEENY